MEVKRANERDEKDPAFDVAVARLGDCCQNCGHLMTDDDYPANYDGGRVVCPSCKVTLKADVANANELVAIND